VQLVEQPGGDFADTIARQLFFSAYQYELYGRLVDSVDETLAAVAAKAVKEVAYHRDHAAQWVVRLGDGTEVSHARMQAGLERMWPYVGELFDSDELERGLAGHDRVDSASCGALAAVCRRGGRGDALDHRRAVTAPGWPARNPHRVVRLPTGGDAAPATVAPGARW
jgi:hypothetical protein